MLCLLGAVGAMPFALAQPVRSASQAAPAGLEQLAEIDDFSFSYAQRGFYAVLEHVKRTGRATLDDAEPLAIRDWRALLERSPDYRGRTVTVEGLVGRNSAWKPLDPQQQALGTVWELQLHRDDQPLICKCILVGDAGDIPLGARLEVTGVFIMIQQYYSDSKRLRQAALLVGVGPTSVSQAVPRRAEEPARSWMGVILALLVGLGLAWFLLRRHLHERSSADFAALRAQRAAPLHLADDLAAWTRQDEPNSKSPPGPDRE
jgi:hypothetical protein